MKSSLRDPEADLELAIFPSHLGIAVLRHPPLSEKTPGIIAIVRVRGVQRRGQRGRCSIKGLTGPRKRTKTVIQNESIDKSEQFIVTNRRYQSHLIRRRPWFTGMASSRISSAAHLPQLSSPTMEFVWDYKKRGENCYKVYKGREVQRNRSGCKCRCV